MGAAGVGASDSGPVEIVQRISSYWSERPVLSIAVQVRYLTEILMYKIAAPLHGNHRFLRFFAW